MDDLEEGAVEREERVSGRTNAQGGNADSDRDDEDLQHVEVEAGGGTAVGNAGGRLQAQDI